MSENLPALFPRLRTAPFRVTSSADHNYNCIAWAAHDARHWWWPVGDAPPIVWPPTAARELTLDAFAAAFLTLGYVGGADESLEPGWEKVALFADPAGTPTHAARQLTSGPWSSNWARRKTLNTNCAPWKAKSTARSL